MPLPTSFAELIASRRRWLEQELQPWCLQASRRDLVRAELEWLDIAGKVDADKTLWYWAWSRFPALVHEHLVAIDESRRVTVRLRNGETHTGHPDSRQSRQGQLVLLCLADPTSRRYEDRGPFSIDDIAEISPA